MKEIDFDELDRAVSSLMNSVPKSEPIKNDNDIKTVNLNSTEADDAAAAQPSIPASSQSVSVSVSEDTTPVSAPEPEVREETPPAATPASRSSATASPATRRGRFMDVMNSPSRGEPRRPSPTARASRQGTTLQPVTSSRSAAVDSPFRSLMNQSSSASENRSAAEPITNQGQEAPEDRSITAPKAEGVTMSPVLQVEDDAIAASMGQPPAASPFLPDARVEKRPLGGRTTASMRPSNDPPAEPAPMSDMSMPDMSASMDVSLDKDAQLPEQPLPAELDSKLLSIETSTEGLPGGAPQAVAPAAAAAPAAASHPSSSTASPAQPAASQPKEDEGSEGAIYDTSTYHQPLAHPTKKKYDWALVVAIAAIVLLGIAGGVAVYYFKLF